MQKLNVKLTPLIRRCEMQKHNVMLTPLILMTGGTGNDTYVVDNIGGRMGEAANDAVYAQRRAV